MAAKEARPVGAARRARNGAAAGCPWRPRAMRATTVPRAPSTMAAMQPWPTVSLGASVAGRQKEMRRNTSKMGTRRARPSWRVSKGRTMSPRLCQAASRGFAAAGDAVANGLSSRG